MLRCCLPVLLTLCWLVAPLYAGDIDPKHDWPVWRGPQGTGVAEPSQQTPLAWSKSENILWKAAVPGRGHGSPVIVGQRVFLQTADEEQGLQSVLCFDRTSGKELWEVDVHTGGLETKGNKKSSQASSTPACDGERLYVNFLNREAVYTTALDLDGQQLWQTRVSGFVMHQGFGSSPALYKNLVYVTTDSKGGGAVAALDRETGEIIWSQERPKQPNYASPIVLHAAGKDQLLVSGCDLVSSFEPLTGKKLWEIEGATTECVTTMVTDGERVFVSGATPASTLRPCAPMAPERRSGRITHSSMSLP